MSRDNGSKFPLSDWQAQTLRLSAFPSPSAQITGQDWWAEVIGDQPESRNSQPRTGQQLESGSYANGQLVLSVRSNRIDWQYAAIRSDAHEGVIIPTLGSFPDGLAAFHELMNKWLTLNSMLPLVRLAFGAVLVHPVENFLEGHNFLQRYSLPDFNLKETSDFLYQISRRKDSNIGIPDLKINRLSKWAMVVVQNIMVSFTPGQIAALPVDSEAFAASLELDINTVPDMETELNPDILLPLFDELIKFGSEIAQEGDIA